MRFDRSIVQAHHPSPLGTLIVASTRHGLAGVWFDDQRHLPDASQWPLCPDHPVLERAIAQLERYFAGDPGAFDLPLDLSGGTDFQRSVWQALAGIPRGATTSYGALSRHVGRPEAARAVGAAVGRNPLTIILPCHRVLGADGALTGYAGGLARKRALLQLESGSRQLEMQ